MPPLSLSHTHARTNARTHTHTHTQTVAAQIGGDVRLVGGSGPDEGRLEVYKGGNWTSVCFSVEGMEAEQGVAQTVCRQLGFNDFSQVGSVDKLG